MAQKQQWTWTKDTDSALRKAAQAVRAACPVCGKNPHALACVDCVRAVCKLLQAHARRDGKGEP